MDRLYEYICEHSRPETDGLKWIRKQTNLRTNRARMLSGPVQGAFLTMMAELTGAQRALEIGAFTGYSGACIAMGLPDSGHLDSLEINDELSDLILEGWEKCGVGDKVTLHTGNALDFLARRQAEAGSPSFIPYDFAFMDANKREYCDYFEVLVPLMKKGGIIMADNTLWDGKVAEYPVPSDCQTREIMRFNDLVANDARVETVILPLRDGLTIMRVL